jgi:glycosyltransferase involved in cell wall biosynthesis
VPPADAAALAKAIRMLHGSPGLRRKLGENGCRAIRERFDWRRAAQQTLAVYEEVCRGRQPATPPPATAASDGGEPAGA